MSLLEKPASVRVHEQNIKADQTKLFLQDNYDTTVVVASPRIETRAEAALETKEQTRAALHLLPANVSQISLRYCYRASNGIPTPLRERQFLRQPTISYRE